MANPDLRPVFEALRDILKPHAVDLDVKTDSDSNFYVDTKFVQKNKKPLFFGAVQVKKNYVSYHLFPLYVAPTMLDDLSPELKTRMQGKACFNFREVDAVLFEEIAALTRAGRRRFQTLGYIPAPK